MSLLSEVTSAFIDNPIVQAHAVSTAISGLMGFAPNVSTDSQGNAVITFTEAQEKIASEYLYALLSDKAAKAPGSSSANKAGLKIKLSGILTRVIIKKYWFVPVIPFVSGFITGRKTSKKGK